MAKCKACGADIVFIKLKTGKTAPCNAQRIPYKTNLKDGALRLILPDGRIARGDLDFESDAYGYESHFATCPAAEIFRRKKDD